MSAAASRTDPLTRPPVVLGLAVAATAAALVGTLLMATSTTLEQPEVAALRTGALALAHIAPALYLWWRHPSSRFPALLLIVAVSFGAYGLVAVDASWAYLFGRLMTFLALALAFYVFLAFPSGRLDDALSRIVVAATAVITVGGWLALALAAPVIPTTIPSLACGDACPPSPISLDASADVAQRITDTVMVLASGVSLLAMGLLVWRAHRAAAGRRLTAWLVAAAAVLNLALLCAYLLRVAFDPGGDQPDGLVTALGLARFGLPIVIAIAVTLDQGRSARAVHALLESLAPGQEEGDLRAALAAVLRDPGLVLARRRDGRWEAPDGSPVAPPGPDDPRVWTEVDGADGRPTVALLHDPSLGQTPEMIDAAASAAAIAIRQQDLADDLRRAVDDLRASRARLATAADEERRRLERDLHDSAQQALVALRVRVAIARETLDGDPGAAGAALDDIDAELGGVLEDLRRLARGLYPPLLEDRGLAEALRAAASRAPIPVSVEGRPDRLPRQVEVAAYYCCREALQNAVKHAGPDARAWVTLEVADGALAFTVRDDGPGFDATGPVAGGTGLTGMRDRAAAVGGSLEVRPSPDGTVVSGRLPLGGGGPSA